MDKSLPVLLDKAENNWTPSTGKATNSHPMPTNTQEGTGVVFRQRFVKLFWAGLSIRSEKP
ncbi:hypothetical protein H7Q97_00320 [Ochrobactrum sp. CM-21-5]|nr:hypothetical protein [Ochrobactrum sp. CM-21-5]MBC2883842.1 hypothetical protein [Ochrobactrum sp. CM-21-5]